MAEETLHWADKIALEVKKRCEQIPELKKIVKKQGYLVYDEKTPSGNIHIGAGRGWIIHDTIAKAMRSHGMKATFVLSSDDIDPFDKMNADLPKEYEKYLGVPFRDIPSPVDGYASFADYYFSQATDKFAEYGIDAELERTGDRYDDGTFNEAIRIVLNNCEKIDKIYKDFYGKAPDKLPFNPICEKCGKIGSTWAIEWDPNTELLKYSCTDDLVPWATGCGHQGEVSPFNGNGKFPWKVEWAAKWFSLGVVCEYAGKDHFTEGGARSISVAIADQVFDIMPPYPSDRKKIGKAYEFFTMGGRKMSTSKGIGINFSNAMDYAPANILRYLLVATRPRAVIDFNPIEKNDLILLYDRFDKTERIYFDAEKLDNEHEVQKHKRLYELAHVGDIPKKMPVQVPFTHCTLIIQAAMDYDKSIALLQESGHVPEKATKNDVNYVKKRLEFAKKFIDEFAPEQFKFTLQEEIDENVKKELSTNQKKALKLLVDRLQSKKYSEKALFEEFYKICDEAGVDNTEFFTAAYKVLINRERGPRLASFILALGKEKVISLFEKL